MLVKMEISTYLHKDRKWKEETFMYNDLEVARQDMIAFISNNNEQPQENMYIIMYQLVSKKGRIMRGKDLLRWDDYYQTLRDALDLLDAIKEAK